MISKNSKKNSKKSLAAKTKFLDGAPNNSAGKVQMDSEAMLRAIVNSNRDAVILIDEKARVIFWNSAAEKTFGYTSEEATGKDVHKLLVPKDMHIECDERIKASLEVFEETGRGYFTVGSVQVKGLRKDGHEFPVELSISPVRSGGKWCAVGIAKDISEQKKAEEMLKEAEQRYHALFDQAPIGVLIVDPTTTSFVEFNDVAHKQLGYTREEFQKLSLQDIEVNESKAEIQRHLSEMIEKGGGEFETLHLTKGGQTKNVWVITREIKLKGRRYLHCIFHDITEIRKVEKALLESEAQHRQLIETAQEGVWVLDRDYSTIFVNPRMAQMLGYAESEMCGKKIFDFMENREEEIANGFLSESRQDPNGNYEYGFIKKDGTHVFTNITASKVKDDNGEDLGTLVLVTDITVRKEMADKLANYSRLLEDRLKQRTQELAETNAKLVKSERLAAIGELAGMVGHDLRNPLTGIKNAAYFLRRKNTFPTPQAGEMLDIIDACVIHSNKIINDLLDYSREIRLECKEVSVKLLAKSALAMVPIPEKVQILTNIEEDQKINADEEKMTRVFINLLKNAIDAMPDGGTIHLNSVTVGASDHVEISVSDTGVGIPAEILPRLFSPLLTTKAQGMGFGLAICKRIVEAHGGIITIKTVVGRGTTFTIILPVENKVYGGEKIWIDQGSLLSTTTKP